MTNKMPFGLSRRETTLAQWLVYYHGRVVSYVFLYNLYYGASEESITEEKINCVRVAVFNIRNKWSRHTPHLDIETIRSAGYTLVYLD